MEMLNIFFSFLLFFNVAQASIFDVEDIARNAIEKNIIHLEQGDFLAAGSHQFGSLWTRDFCFSVPGLLLIGKKELVKNQLNYLIGNRRKDGLVPIYADSISPMIRVMMSSLNDVIGTQINLKITSKLKPFYQAVGKYPTIDANLMVLLAADEYYRATGDEAWWRENLESLKSIYHYYDHFLDDGLIVQGAFADWQDSAKRAGKTFFTNLLYLDVSKRLAFKSDKEIESLQNNIEDHFYDAQSGLYFSVEGSEFISLEGVLWAIDHGLLKNKEELYQNLKHHPLWNQMLVPGFATFPSYPKNWIAAHNRLSGLWEYHGNLTWSWLTAYSSIVAKRMNDDEAAFRIKSFLDQLIRRDQTVNEIYQSSKNFMPFKSFLYRSEKPFSWGAAFILEANHFVR